MKKNCELTPEEWAIKRKFDIAFNKIFFTNGFTEFVVKEYHYRPRGLTFDTQFEDNGQIVFDCCVKTYGIDTSTANGVSGDIGDYEKESVYDKKYTDLCMEFVNMTNKELVKEIVDSKAKVLY